MLGIMAGINQKDRYVARCRAHRRLRQWHVQGWSCWYALRAVIPSIVVWPMMLGIMDGMEQKDSYVVSSLQGRRHPWSIPMVWTVQQIIEFRQLLLYKVVDVPV